MSRSLQKKPPIQTDWWTKTCAGALLGLTLAFALSGLFAWFGPGGIAAPQKVQFVMWIIAPIWMLIFSLVYLFRTGLRALAWLAGINVAAYAILFSAPQLLAI